MVPPGQKHFDPAFEATLRRAVVRRIAAQRPLQFPLLLESGDFLRKQRFRPCGHTIVFVVDASESMGSGTHIRMRAAKGAILAILRKAYLSRDQAAMVAFGGDHARVVLSPTRSIDLARKRLQQLASGGATPFSEGLYLAWRLVRVERTRDPGLRPILVILSDGEANTPMTPGADPWEELCRLSDSLRRDGIVSILIDAVSRFEPSDRMPGLAKRLGASYIRADHLRSRQILEAVREIEEHEE